MDYISKSPQETKKLATKLASELSGGEVLCLYGDLGAGKTTFITGIVNYFIPGARIISPTFIIVRHYEVPKHFIKNIYHIDLYRLEKNLNLDDLGLMDFFYKSNALVLIEWAQYLGKFIPQTRTDIHFRIKSKDQRFIKIGRALTK